MRNPDHYLLPRHDSEIDRLDLQHHALRQVLGRNLLAPVEAPGLVLDVGAGSGRWGWEVAEQFPGARVVGLDLVPSRPGGPERYRCVRANLLAGLPFREGCFDLVHQRLMFVSIPTGSWHSVVHDLVRVTRGGGWIELVEGRLCGFENPGPHLKRFSDLVLAAAAARGLDAAGTPYRLLDDYLRAVGCVDVQRHEVRVPFGEWAGRIGSLLATDFRLAGTRILEAQPVQLPLDELTDLIMRAQEEFEERRVTMTMAIAVGQRPVGR